MPRHLSPHQQGGAVLQDSGPLCGKLTRPWHARAPNEWCHCPLPAGSVTEQTDRGNPDLRNVSVRLAIWAPEHGRPLMMAVDGSDCPEDSNSTDCLLRPLMRLLNEQKKAEDNETNWDPITFFFTLPVGILATIFAVTTVFQGILVAGKGRRKTNKRAIGKWHQATEWHWNWQDMSFESRAWLSTWKQWVQNSQPKYQSDPAATWVRFFEKIGLEYLDDPKYKDQLQPVTADYLPDDLIAAPAYGQVGAIIAAAAATGAQIKMTDDKSLYPVILGRQFQFDFRQRPTLGIIGAYSQYTQGRNDEDTHTEQKDGLRYIKSELSTSPGKLSMAMKHCRGDIGLEEGMMTPQPFQKMPQDSLNLYKEPHRYLLIKRLEDRSSNGDYSLPSLGGLNDMDAYCPIIIFFLAATPEYAPSLFPASILKTILPLTPVGLNGKYWSALYLGAFNNSKPSEWPIGHEKPKWEGFHHYWGQDIVLSMNNSDEDEDYDDYRWGRDGYFLMKTEHFLAGFCHHTGINLAKPLDAIVRRPGASINQGEKIDHEKAVENDIEKTRKTRERGMHPNAIRGDTAVLHACHSFLRDPCAFLEWFATFSASSQAQIRRRVHRQLLKVQVWLERKGRDYVNSRLLLLCKTTVILLKAQRAADEDLVPNPFKAPDTPDAPSSLHSHHSNALNPLRNLLKNFGLDEKTSHHVERMRKFSKENNIDWERSRMPPEHQEYIKIVRGKIMKHRSDLLRYFSYQDLASQCYVNIYGLLERLATVVACNSSPEDSCPEWERLKELESPHNDTDDVVIYRYLMLAILYRTAPDSEKMLHSGIWDQVVPII
ncbi:hypothetical protein CNYM01_10234 [Colletotrichum nymphaeae SA-01]|uniref:Uncharacterized protein n=1 Tax=Colletotrichum nymphaeae SA-01 TaxID=1460502 RepID=A0A135RYL2_9PEZI|nr:hypothetical protein CNYM01_10234 [Colletotrichum nymphaeae SA-01]